MIIAQNSAVIRFDKTIYSIEGLAAGALNLGARAQILVEESKLSFKIKIMPSARSTRSELLALGGEFLNAVLNHEYRQRVVKFNAPLTQAVLSPLLAKGFPAVPTDPLEELEPQVKAERADELAELLARAEAMK